MADSKGNSKGNRPNRPVRPRQAPGGRKRRVVIDSGAAAAAPGLATGPRAHRATAEVAAGPAADRPRHGPLGRVRQGPVQALGVAAAQIIKIMMGLGEMVTITQSLSDEAVS